MLLLFAFVLVVVGGVVLVWLPYQREQGAIAEVERLGGMTQSDVGWIPDAARDWIPNAVYNNCQFMFGRVWFVKLRATDATDHDLGHLKKLPETEWLFLDGTQVTDAGLLHVRQLPRLRWLWLDGTQVTDAGLANLEPLLHLNVISLSDTDISDAGLGHLDGLSKLETIFLENTRVTETGVDRLQNTLPDCRIEWTRPSP